METPAVQELTDAALKFPFGSDKTSLKEDLDIPAVTKLEKKKDPTFIAAKEYLKNSLQKAVYACGREALRLEEESVLRPSSINQTTEEYLLIAIHTYAFLQAARLCNEATASGRRVGDILKKSQPQDFGLSDIAEGFNDYLQTKQKNEKDDAMIRSYMFAAFSIYKTISNTQPFLDSLKEAPEFIVRPQTD